MTPLDAPAKSRSQRRIILPKISAKLWFWTLAGILLVGVGATVTYYWRSRSQATLPVVETSPVITSVTALGRLEPEGETIQLKASTSTQESRIDRLLVKVGDRVKKGQTIAILNNRDRLQASFDRAETEVLVARAKLKQVEAGAKRGEITAQTAEIHRLEADRKSSIVAQQAIVQRLQAELHNADVEYRRYETLYQQGAISASSRDSKQLAWETAKLALQEAEAELTRLETTQSPELNKAKATLAQIQEVRTVDVAVLQAELERAIAAMAEAKTALEQAYVRSPQDGTVMEIHTRAGETIATEGIVEIGTIDRMVAIAEVYESDISKINLGKTAIVTSNALPQELKGTVSRIDLKVRQQTAINTDPSQNIDAKVIEVQIRLDTASSKVAATFTNLQVEVRIDR